MYLFRNELYTSIYRYVFFFLIIFRGIPLCDVVLSEKLFSNEENEEILCVLLSLVAFSVKMYVTSCSKIFNLYFLYIFRITLWYHSEDDLKIIATLNVGLLFIYR